MYIVQTNAPGLSSERMLPATLGCGFHEDRRCTPALRRWDCGTIINGDGSFILHSMFDGIVVSCQRKDACVGGLMCDEVIRITPSVGV